MPRPLLALVAVAALLAGCKKPGPAEPSEADAKEAYVAYKKLAAESRAAKQNMDVNIALQVEAEEVARKATGQPSHSAAKDSELNAIAKVDAAQKEYGDARKRATAMEEKWERRWARLGLSLEPLTASTPP